MAAAYPPGSMNVPGTMSSSGTSSPAAAIASRKPASRSVVAPTFGRPVMNPMRR